MKNNIDNLDFVSNEAELFELAKLVNIANKKEVVGEKTIERIISLGLTTRVLNVIPYRIARVGSYEDFLSDNDFRFFYDNYSFLNIFRKNCRGYGGWYDIYAIPRYNYIFDEWSGSQGDLWGELEAIDDVSDKVIVLMDESHGGYTIQKVKYTSPMSNNYVVE